MRQLAKVTMTMRDLDRLKCIQAVADGNLKPGRAADRLGLTTRQVRRLTQRYAQEGPVGLISRHRNRPSNNRLDPCLAERVIGCRASIRVTTRDNQDDKILVGRNPGLLARNRPPGGDWGPV
jgi:hypothetical protein